VDIWSGNEKRRSCLRNGRDWREVRRGWEEREKMCEELCEDMCEEMCEKM